MKARKSGEKGFTLIELLVVISILGVLAAVVTLNVTKFIGSGCNQAKATELHNVQTAVAAYMYDHGGTVPPDTTTSIKPYFMGTAHGQYSVNTTGEVSQTSYDCSQQ